MANGFGGLYIGSSGLQTAQNGLNVIANNLSNINTEGYVRQQVLYSDKEYTSFADASVSTQLSGLGVTIGDVIHSRDVFLDSSYRTQSSRQAFYASQYDATYEVETFLQEMDGADFKSSMADLYEAFAEYAKDPSDAANQNLVVQKAELFIERATSVNDGLKEYQSTINTKITNDVDRINEIGERIVELNRDIQRIEAAGVETAMDDRDERDALLDELSGLARISYSETIDGIVKVKLEGQEFISEGSYNEIGLQTDKLTGFVNPYWSNLSDIDREDYYNVFNLDNVCASNNNDKGEVKSLLLARGDSYATYMDMVGLSSQDYEKGLGNSVMMNAESEMDTLVHSIVTAVNDMLSPTTNIGSVDSYNKDGLTPITAASAAASGVAADADHIGDYKLYDEAGIAYYISADAKVADVDNCSVGSDGQIPPEELFSRTGCDRYTTYYFKDASGNNVPIYVYNEEDTADQSTCYTIHSLEVNEDLTENQSHIAYKTQTGEINYDLAQKLSELWDDAAYTLNPSDTTPATFQNFYTKFVGELATNENVFQATSESLQTTVDSVDSSRQEVIGVSSDEELTNMIKYQNAYNAASRYINVVSSMIDTLIQTVS